MDDCWRGELIADTASLKLASASRQHILDPLAFLPIVATGARAFNWPSDISRLCQRTESFFVSIAAEGSE